MTALADADVICIETMSDLREALLAVRAARDTLPDTPVMALLGMDTAMKSLGTA